MYNVKLYWLYNIKLNQLCDVMIHFYLYTDLLIVAITKLCFQYTSNIKMFMYICVFLETLADCCDLSQLWYREFYLNITKDRIQVCAVLFDVVREEMLLFGIETCLHHSQYNSEFINEHAYFVFCKSHFDEYYYMCL